MANNEQLTLRMPPSPLLNGRRRIDRYIKKCFFYKKSSMVEVLNILYNAMLQIFQYLSKLK